MRRILSGKSGFTLVELLVVTGILGLVIGAIYSLYLTHMRTAFNQDEIVEVQQNLRIAMDAVTRDLKMAGALVPYGTPAIDPTSTATTLIINTGAPTDAVVRINKTKDSLAFSNFSTTVDSPDVLDKFTVGDHVRVIRPYDGSQPFYAATMGNYTTMAVQSKGTSSITLKRVNSASFDTGITIKNGDMVSKKNASPQARFDTITYSVGNCPTGSGLSGSCLYRLVNGAAPGDPMDVIASNLAGITFTYITESSYGSSSNTSVQVTIDGVTVKKASATDTPRTRQLTSIVKLRNRRYY